jgi:hypothetical protein
VSLAAVVLFLLFFNEGHRETPLNPHQSASAAAEVLESVFNPRKAILEIRVKTI